MEEETHPGEEEVTQTVESILEEAENGETPEELLEVLDAFSSLPSYSYRNGVWLKIQAKSRGWIEDDERNYPPKMVAGYGTWKEEHGRVAEKGSSGLNIMYPMQGKVCPDCGYTRDYYKHDEQDCEFEKDHENWPVKTFKYGVGTVFDISQTVIVDSKIEEILEEEVELYEHNGTYYFIDSTEEKYLVTLTGELKELDVPDSFVDGARRVTNAAELPDDVSQAIGEHETPDPTLDRKTEQGSVEKPEKLFKSVRKAHTNFTSELTIEVLETTEYRQKNGGGNGVYIPDTNTIKIREQESKADMTRVLIHEYAHALLHSEDTEKDKGQKEVEAECIAYVVSKHLGLDPSKSDVYIHSWANKTDKDLKDSLNEIQQTSYTIIDTIK